MNLRDAERLWLETGDGVAYLKWRDRQLGSMPMVKWRLPTQLATVVAWLQGWSHLIWLHDECRYVETWEINANQVPVGTVLIAIWVEQAQEHCIFWPSYQNPSPWVPE